MTEFKVGTAKEVGDNGKTWVTLEIWEDDKLVSTRFLDPKDAHEIGRQLAYPPEYALVKVGGYTKN